MPTFVVLMKESSGLHVQFMKQICSTYICVEVMLIEIYLIKYFCVDVCCCKCFTEANVCQMLTP